MSSFIKSTLYSVVFIFLGLGMFTYLLHGESGNIFLDIDYHGAYYIVAVASLIISWMVVLLEKGLDPLLSWKDHMSLRFLISLVGNTGIIMLTIYLFYIFINTNNYIPIDDISIYIFTQNIIIKLIILIFITVFIGLTFSLTMFSYKHYASGQIESVKLTRRQYELQFEALKSQLSPHYLFNCLNTISSLVYINPEEAETYIRRLVQTYQYILNTKDRKLVTLTEELVFVNAYKFLLKVRYQDALKLTIEIPENVHQSLLPPLTLQMLVENAVKHNDVSDDEPLKIKICLDHNHLITVSNSKNEKKIQDTSFKIGIENIRKRYQYFTKNSINVLNSDRFSVSLPILEANVDKS